MTTTNKTMREKIAERERSGYRTDVYDLVSSLKTALDPENGRPDTYTAAKAAVGLLLDSLNAGSERDAIPGIVAGIVSTHRHLQGVGIFALLKALGHLPELEHATDARNEHAYKACAELREALRERIYWRD
jgi:hypothetical protein